MPAPIGLSAYCRLEHLRRTVEALHHNELASESELYVFSDAPKPGDEDKVKAVREYLRTIRGFREVHLLEREENSRVKNNRGGMRQLLDQYGRMIFLEEDVVTAPGFLRFMNEGLDFYQDDERIFALCGYSPPIRIPRSYQKDVYLSQRFSAWGFGIWKDRYDKIVMDVSMEDYEEIIHSPSKLKAFKVGGPDLPDMLERLATGRVDALDIRIFYTMYVYKMFTVHPTYSLTQNIGFDGSGAHCPADDRFSVELNRAKAHLALEPLIQLDKSILRRLTWFRWGTLKGQAYLLRERLLGRL